MTSEFLERGIRRVIVSTAWVGRQARDPDEGHPRTPLGCAIAMVVTVAILSGCGSTAPALAVSPSPPIATPLTISRAPMSSEVAPKTTATASADPSAVALNGFSTWLKNPDLELEAGVDGTDAGILRIYGIVQVHGGDSFQLMGGESGAVFIYERSLIGGQTTRSIGPQYSPAAVTLTDTERFAAALASSTGWADLGIGQRDGQTLHHLEATTTGLTDAGLLVDSVPPDAPAEIRALTHGRLEAWVQADGTPAVFEYLSDSLDLTFRIRQNVDGAISDNVEPQVSHTSSRYGYAFSAPASMSFHAVPDGEQSAPAPVVITTFCKARKAGGSLEQWAGGGYAYYSKLWGTASSILQTAVFVKGHDEKSAIPVVLSTYTDSTVSGDPVAIVNAAFATKSYDCDLQSAVRTPFGDEAHARFDRLHLTLRVAR